VFCLIWIAKALLTINLWRWALSLRYYQKMLEVFVFSKNAVAPICKADPLLDGIRVVRLRYRADAVNAFGLLRVLGESSTNVPGKWGLQIKVQTNGLTLDVGVGQISLRIQPMWSHSGRRAATLKGGRGTHDLLSCDRHRWRPVGPPIHQETRCHPYDNSSKNSSSIRDFIKSIEKKGVFLFYLSNFKNASAASWMSSVRFSWIWRFVVWAISCSTVVIFHYAC